MPAAAASVEEAQLRIERDPGLNAFVSLSEERGPGPLMAVKDNIDVRGCVTTGGSGDARGRPQAERDAAAVALMREGGYRVVGKTGLHEHGLGSTNHNPHFGPVRNPHDRSRISGGSSGGSAAAVVEGLSDVGVGTDTGGSIRIPSGLCGAVGLRPTFGKVSMEGVTLLAHTMDVVGPIARTVPEVASAAALLGIVPRGWAPGPAPTSPRLATPAGWAADMDPEVTAAWARIAPDLEPIELGGLDAFVEPGLVSLYAEAAANHREQLEERPGTLGADVRALMLDGSRIPVVDYILAQVERDRLRRRIDSAFERFDALIVPTTRRVAPPVETDPLELRDWLTRFTRPFSVTGHPVLALPIASPGLPVGLQVVGPRDGEAALLELGAALAAAWS